MSFEADWSANGTITLCSTEVFGLIYYYKLSAAVYFESLMLNVEYGLTLFICFISEQRA